MPNSPNRLLNGVRWLFFLPCAIVAATLASWIFGLGGSMYGEILAALLSGVAASATMITVGATVAPCRNHMVKWILIGVSVLLGGLDVIANERSPSDEESHRFIMGIATVGTALLFAKLSPRDLPSLSKPS